MFERKSTWSNTREFDNVVGAKKRCEGNRSYYVYRPSQNIDLFLFQKAGNDLPPAKSGFVFGSEVDAVDTPILSQIKREVLYHSRCSVTKHQ